MIPADARSTMPRPRLIITRRLPDAAEAALAKRFEVERNRDDAPFTPDRMREALLTHDAICPTLTDRIGADILSVPNPRTRILANYGAGVDHIDLQAARAAGIVVTNTPDVLSEATAEIALLLMLMASRRAGEGERLVRAGQWTGWAPTQLVGRSPAGRVLGLVGFGRIAQITAERARAAFGMRILYHSRRRAAPEVEARLGANYRATLGALAEESDIVSLHCPGGPETHHLVDRALLARMKPQAVLVNTARGTVIDEVALADALVAGTIAAAGLDVYEREPAIDPRLLAREDVVLLPHLGSATIETRAAMGLRVAENLSAFFAGSEPPDRVA